MLKSNKKLVKYLERTQDELNASLKKVSMEVAHSTYLHRSTCIGSSLLTGESQEWSNLTPLSWGYIKESCPMPINAYLGNY